MRFQRPEAGKKSGGRLSVILKYGRGRRLLAAIGLLFGLWAAFFLPSRIVSAADIRVTKHNLARSQSTADAEEVCVFCHTPQVPADLPEGSAVTQPVWQRSLPHGYSFLMFDDIGRKQFGKLAVGSQSIACLSCHDATQAFSVTSTQSDHPFGVPYRGYLRTRGGGDLNAAPAVDDGTMKAARYLKAVTDFRAPSKGVIEDRVVWWVSASGSSAVRSRSDLPLYVRDVDGGEIPYIECSSCHDPHLAKPLFLRVDNASSRLCLTCHDK